MQDLDPLEYYRRREQQERERARAASHPVAAERHQELASKY